MQESTLDIGHWTWDSPFRLHAILEILWWAALGADPRLAHEHPHYNEHHGAHHHRAWPCVAVDAAGVVLADRRQETVYEDQQPVLDVLERDRDKKGEE